MSSIKPSMASIQASLPRFCPVCSGDPDATFELRIIGVADISIHVACLHCKPAEVPIGVAPAYQDKTTKRGTTS